MSILLQTHDVPSLAKLFWSLALASCQVYDDLTANCWGFIWNGPW